MGPAILDEVSDVISFTRFVPVLTVKPYCVFSVFDNSKLVYTANEDKGFYADSAFLKIFSFNLSRGSITALMSGINVITRSLQKRSSRLCLIIGLLGPRIMDAEVRRITL